MPSVAKHVGIPESCPCCGPLPVDWNLRQEAIWQHAVSQFVDQSGVDVSPLSRADLVPLVRSWAQTKAVARMSQTLFDETDSPLHTVGDRFTPRSARLALFLMLAVLACLGIICSGVWRFLS